MRVAVIGWPGTGKTTLGRQLAAEMNLPFYSTDAMMAGSWPDASVEVARWLDFPQWVIEGVTLPRAFRKWRALHPGERAPVDHVIRLGIVHRPLLPGAIRLGRGHDTVLAELVGWLPVIENRGSL